MEDSKAPMHRVTLIPGDGTGPETCAAARRCVEATGIAIRWDEREAGADAHARTGVLVPDATVESIRRNRVALKGPVSTPAGSGLPSVNVQLRQTLDLFACVRPCRLFPGVRSRLGDAKIDLVIIRENSEDFYAGVEFEAGQPETMELISRISGRARRPIRDDAGLSIRPISEFASRRIARFAFDYARRMGRRKITVVHKSNILRHTDGLFLQAARGVAKEFPEIRVDDRVIDNLGMQLVQKPEDFDTLLMPNFYGDIVSDLAVGMVGGLAVVPGANFGPEAAIFETIHGSAARFKGQNKVNPTGMILAGAWMLRHLGEHEASERLEGALLRVLAQGRDLTYDLKPDRGDASAVGTREMADAVIAAM
jgi:isocitrate dehydrogenase (NAD+)